MITRMSLGRRLALAAAAVVFVVLSVIVGRWLAADGAERAKVERLLGAQARGDVAAMRRELDGCDDACAAKAQRLAQRLRGDGRLEIVRYDSKTSHALGAETAPTRVVWQLAAGETVVQCVRVQRKGNALSGPSVTLLDLSAPIGREASC